MRPKPGRLDVDWIEIVRIGRADWRVSDSRLSGSDPDRLLGYVERIGRARYEVVWTTEPLRWAYVGSLELAITAFVQGARFGGTTSAERAGCVLDVNDFLIPRGRRRGHPNEVSA